MISADDIELLHVTDDPDDAVRLVLDATSSAPIAAPQKEDAQ